MKKSAFIAEIQSKHNRYYVLFFLLCFITAVMLACCNLNNPGLYYDEMLFVNAALGGKSNIFINHRFMGVPVFLMEYIGALKAWIYYPIFSIFGVNTWSVRLPAILFGTTGAMMLVAALWRGFGPRAAVAGAVMILLDPTIIIHSRLDWGPNALMFFFRGLLILSVVSWIRTMKVQWAWIAAFAAALGIFDKLNFIWMAGAAFGSLVVVYSPKLKAFTRNRPTHALLLTAMATGGLAAAVVRGISVAEHTDIGWGSRLRYAVSLIRYVLSGGGALNFISGNGLRPEPWFWAGYAVALIIGIWGIRQIIKSEDVKRLFIWALVLFAFVTMAFVLTKTATGPHHSSMLCGLWQFILAPLVGAVWNSYGSAIKSVRIVTLFSLVLVAAGSITATVICIRAFAKPINVNWDPANTKAALLVKEHPDANFICTDWGMGTLAIGNSKTFMNINDAWPSFTKEEDAVSILKNINREQDTYIYTLRPEFENFKGNRANVLNALQKNNIKPQLYKVFPNWKGEPMIEVLRVPAEQLIPR